MDSSSGSDFKNLPAAWYSESENRDETGAKPYLPFKTNNSSSKPPPNNKLNQKSKTSIVSVLSGVIRFGSLLYIAAAVMLLI